MAVCPICRQPLAGVPTWGVGKVTFCEPCYRSTVAPRRGERMQSTLDAMRSKTAEKFFAELRHLRAERDRLRTECDTLRADVRDLTAARMLAEARAAVVSVAAAGPVWQCFAGVTGLLLRPWCEAHA